MSMLRLTKCRLHQNWMTYHTICFKCILLELFALSQEASIGALSHPWCCLPTVPFCWWLMSLVQKEFVLFRHQGLLLLASCFRTASKTSLIQCFWHLALRKSLQLWPLGKSRLWRMGPRVGGWSPPTRTTTNYRQCDKFVNERGSHIQLPYPSVVSLYWGHISSASNPIGDATTTNRGHVRVAWSRGGLGQWWKPWLKQRDSALDTILETSCVFQLDVLPYVLKVLQHIPHWTATLAAKWSHSFLPRTDLQCAFWGHSFACLYI